MALSTWLAIRPPGQSDWFDGVIPIALLLWAVKSTERYPGQYKQRAG